MQILGYIVSKGKVKVDCDFVKKVNDFSMVEEGKPCMICGLSEAKAIASDNFSILRKKIRDGLYWTFGRTEKRDEHESDIAKFCNDVMSAYIAEIKYKYLNVLCINTEIAKRCLIFLHSSQEKYIYIWNDMIYISCPNKTVVGVSLKMCEYGNIGKEKLLGIIRANKSNIVIDDDTRIPRTLMGFIKDKRYSVPFIMQLIKR